MASGKTRARLSASAKWFVILIVVTVILGAAILVWPQGLDRMAQTGVAVAAALKGGFPVTVEDCRGQAVTLDRAPARLASAAPAVTEILFAIGAAGEVVGVDEWSNYPPEVKQVPSIGPYYPLNIEGILALKPDLVVAMGEQAEWTAQLEQLGVKVFLIDPKSIDDVQATIVSVGQVTGHRREAEHLAESIRQRIEAVARKVATIPQAGRVRVFYEVYADPLMTVGPQCLIGQMVTAAGGLSISADSDLDYPTISAEEVINRDPQVIVFPDVHGTATEGAAGIKSRPGWASISAVRDGRIYPVDPDVFSRAGPRVGDAVETLARLLYPEVFR